MNMHVCECHTWAGLAVLQELVRLTLGLERLLGMVVYHVILQP